MRKLRLEGGKPTFQRVAGKGKARRDLSAYGCLFKTRLADQVCVPAVAPRICELNNSLSRIINLG